MQVSKIHSSMDARAAMRPLEFKNLEKYGALSKIGISGLDKIIEANFAMDTIQQGVTPASIPTLLQFLQAWLPGAVGVITAAQKIDDIVGRVTVGNWRDEQVVQSVLEITGTAVPYGDLTNIPFTSWNQTYVPRTIVRFENGLRVGRLEEERAGQVRVNSGAVKRSACAIQLNIQRNLVGFYGYNSGNDNTYGFLNDPNLPAYVTVAATGTGSSTLWVNKDFQGIIGDLITAFAQLQNQSLDTINPETTETTLALATIDYQFLSKTTDFGMSVRQWLTDTYPKCRVVSAPQLNGANGGSNVFVLFADKVNLGMEQDISTDDGRTFLQAVPATFQVIGVAQQVKGYEEGYSNATAGVMVKRPWATVRYTGI